MKILPKLLLSFVLLFFFFLAPTRIFAQAPSPGSGLGVGTSSPAPFALWEQDKDVTFVGKFASRSSHLLNWVIQNYTWSQVKPDQPSPFSAIYVRISQIVWAILILTILVAAFLIIITRGASVSIKKFIPRFLLAVALVALSFSIVTFIYTITDVIQGFFLRKPPPGNELISVKDLLNIHFDYVNFIGYRQTTPSTEESAYMSLLLVRITAIIYYIMFILLIVRKVILWFFLVISPVFPLLLLFAPLRNSAKIWVGEFFRWVLYAPLFAAFLSGLVFLWSQYIPLNLENADVGNQDKIIYPTVVNILLGGPNQPVSLFNSVNLPETYIQYVIALIMLVIVIFLPFLLLKIFLDYFYNFQYSDSNLARYVATTRNTISDKYPKLGFLSRGNVPPGSPPSSSGSTGRAMSLPNYNEFAVSDAETQFNGSVASSQSTEAQTNISNEFATALSQSMAHSNIGDTSSVSSTSSVTNSEALNSAVSQAAQNLSNTSSSSNASSLSQAVQQAQGPNFSSSALASANLSVNSDITEILNLTNLSIPTMRDIAKYETSLFSSDQSHTQEAHKIFEKLNRIAGKSPIQTPIEKQNYTKLRDVLSEQAKSGNTVANAILSAAVPTNTTKLPASNRVQTVNLDDYEEVKRTWKDNYSKAEVPSGLKSRQDWLNAENKQITEAITLLTSADVKKQQEGQEMVSKILPFLLLGGFSQNETIAYLKAKQEAAKSVVVELDKSTSEEVVQVQSSHQEKPKVMHLSATLPEDDREGEESEDSSLSRVGSDVYVSIVAKYFRPEHVKQITTLTSLPIPTIVDVAKFESQILSQIEEQKKTINRIYKILDQIAGVDGDITPQEKQKLIKVRDELQKSAQEGNEAASSVLAASKPQDSKLPEKNNVQLVDLSDYELVKRAWVDNYTKQETPHSSDGKIQTKSDWLKSEIELVNKVSTMLISPDPEQEKQAKEMIGKLLPFLLLGGFSKQEMLGYLKAKQESAKTVLETEEKTSQESGLVDADPKQKDVNNQTMTLEAEIPKDPVKDTHENDLIPLDPPDEKK